MNKENILKYIREKEYVLIVFLVLLSFGYILFFTQCIPFFFDDHEFHRDYMQQSYTDFFHQTFSFNHGGISDGSRPVYGTLFKIMFYFFKYNYCWYRSVKAVIFSLLIAVLYFLGKYLLKRKSAAVVFSLYIMTLFPLFIQTFGYNGPHIIAELFKLLALLFFLKDMESEKTKWTNQIIVFFFALLGVRTYPPVYSIAGILILYTSIYNRKKFLRYLPLFFAIVMIQFPVTFTLGALDPDSGSVYGPKLINIKSVFLNDFGKNIITPVPTMKDLYYKSFTAIVTFFGFWLIVFVVGILVVKRLLVVKRWVKNENDKKYFIEIENNLNERMIFCLTFVWMLCEIPAYIFLPEHAIRYIFPFFIPFSLFIAVLILKMLSSMAEQLKRGVVVFVLIIIVSCMLTNSAYTYAFRAGWGSSFIVFENGMTYFAEQPRNGTIGVMYGAGSAADEYFYVNKSSENYTFGQGIEYIKVAGVDGFSEASIKEAAKNYDEFYVIKRITSFSKIGYPDVALESYSTLEEVAIFEGSEDTLFDRINLFLTTIFGIEYNPNTITIYKVRMQD